ncbi:hypothetical protein [Erythrobacter sp. HL-111]|uniref:hypothetical protein n=1 Tax=Erythrobacter sp. HL-111 TaxID=1798193 RepID=UPI0012F9543C|nr:hypothetical protein [Erythrobacter sp. HL-111]
MARPDREDFRAALDQFVGEIEPVQPQTKDCPKGFFGDDRIRVGRKRGFEIQNDPVETRICNVFDFLGVRILRKCQEPIIDYIVNIAALLPCHAFPSHEFCNKAAPRGFLLAPITTSDAGNAWSLSRAGSRARRR